MTRDSRAYGFAPALPDPLFGGNPTDFPAHYPGPIHPVDVSRVPVFWLLPEQEDNSETTLMNCGLLSWMTSMRIAGFGLVLVLVLLG